MNNVTTVSHTFVVYLTIGYFEIEAQTIPAWPTSANVPPPPPKFGAEVYDKVPGDMRQKYIAVIDMSSVGLKPVFPAFANDTDPHAQGPPLFTALDKTARAGSTVISVAYSGGTPDGVTLPVMADSQLMSIRAAAAPSTPATQLVIGHGVEEQVVTVIGVGPCAAGPGMPPNPVPLAVGELEVTPLTRDVWAGTSVSNVRPGYAGPQPDFTIDRNSAKYRAVLPYVERVR